MLRKSTLALFVVVAAITALGTWGGVSTQNALSLRHSNELDRCKQDLLQLRTRLRVSPAAPGDNSTEAYESSPAPAPTASNITEPVGKHPVHPGQSAAAHVAVEQHGGGESSVPVGAEQGLTKREGGAIRYHDPVSTGVPSVVFGDINSKLPIEPVLAIMFTGQLRLWWWW